MKNIKCISILAIIFLMIIVACQPLALATQEEALEDVSGFANQVNYDLSQETSSLLEQNLTLNSRSCIVLERSSLRILYGKNEFHKVKMASTTKIMTATVVLEQANLNDIVQVSKRAAGIGGSRLGLKIGDKITIRDLLYGLMLCSGNDAAVCLAECVGGSIEGFADLMNAKAESLGLTSTHFVTPHGLDADEHYTTAYELALLANYALTNPQFSEIVGTKNYTVTINGYPKNLSNTNELLGNLSGVYGVKTGFTNGANRCLVTSCKRDNLDVICVVLGADTKKFRTQDSIKLLEYTFKNYKMVHIENFVTSEFENWRSKHINSFSVSKGVIQTVEPYLEISNCASFPLTKSEHTNLTSHIICSTKIYAPIAQNQELGKLYLMVNENTTLPYRILSKNAIVKKDVLDYLLHFYQFFFSYVKDIC